MAGFSFDNGGRRCIRPILEKYQSGKDHLYYGFIMFFRLLAMYIQYQMRFYPCKGESDGYIVQCKEKEFPISNYPLEQTEFYYAQKQGMVCSSLQKNCLDLHIILIFWH